MGELEEEEKKKEKENCGACSEIGSTALILAARHGYVEIADLLVRNGADLDLQNMPPVVGGDQTGYCQCCPEEIVSLGTYYGCTAKPYSDLGVAVTSADGGQAIGLKSITGFMPSRMPCVEKIPSHASLQKQVGFERRVRALLRQRGYAWRGQPQAEYSVGQIFLQGGVVQWQILCYSRAVRDVWKKVN